MQVPAAACIVRGPAPTAPHYFAGTLQLTRELAYDACAAYLSSSSRACAVAWWAPTAPFTQLLASCTPLSWQRTLHPASWPVYALNPLLQPNLMKLGCLLVLRSRLDWQVPLSLRLWLSINYGMIDRSGASCFCGVACKGVVCRSSWVDDICSGSRSPQRDKRTSCSLQIYSLTS